MIILQLFLPIILCSNVQGASKKEITIFKELLQASPDIGLIRPKQEDSKATNVSVSVYLRHIDEVNSKSMDISLQVTFRMRWNDPRLKFNDNYGRIKYISVPYNSTDAVWKPDVYFTNSIETGELSSIYPDEYVRIFSDGDVLASKRMNLKLSCDMHMQFYPFDTQTCPLMLASYGYKASEVHLLWNDNFNITPNSLSTKEFVTKAFEINNCLVTTSSGLYSCALLKLELERKPFFMVHMYMLPGVAFVSLSWLVFWLKPHALVERFTLLILCYALQLLMIYLSDRVRPPSSRLTALDAWHGICLLTLMIELIVTLKLCSDKIDDTIKGQETETKTESQDPEQNDVTVKTVTTSKIAQISSLLTDTTARFMFPLLYYLTVVIYFLIVTNV